jgi:hypothetical protein
MKIGRYRILGRYGWFQTSVPVTIRRFSLFTIVKEARPTDVDEVQQFRLWPPTYMEYEGRRYRYWRAPVDTPKGTVVFGVKEK